MYFIYSSQVRVSDQSMVIIGLVYPTEAFLQWVQGGDKTSAQKRRIKILIPHCPWQKSISTTASSCSTTGPYRAKPLSLKQATVNVNSLMLCRKILPANRPLKSANSFQLSPRTVDDVLHNATGRAFENLRAGYYIKL